ncbi:acetyltransferase [Alkalihalobacillus sp. AL-G]|uniref:acetyltransferase n=1 Tax=Alkalihalobacillus sp. AL-G TaxID=2926399 RepID=UPI00272DBFDF|nr:acetyltransferase [Alkalihalobacillus sp. AL-G]WLD93014.1 acetyltransferase [Alkalihalobacillus sp. AL-G]
MSDKLILWGCGGHAREVSHLCEQIGLEIIGYLDERKEMKGKIVNDLPVLGDIDDILNLRGRVKIVCSSVGSPTLKERFVKKTLEYGFDFSDPIIHPNVYISKRNVIGKGSIICEGVILTVNIEIGDFVIVNRKVTIGHDCNIGDYSTVSPGVNISGNIKIGEKAYIGTGASVREKITIGKSALIGGGAFVKDDVPNNTLFAGVPAVFQRIVEDV